MLAACVEVPPPAAIDAAFIAIDGPRLTLRRDALGAPFVLTPRVVVSGVAPQVQALLPKIVAFELHGDTLALVQRTLGAIHDELPSGRLLDTFPVETSDPEAVTFRWEQALTRVTLGSPVVVSDWPATLEAALAPQEETLAPVTSVLTHAAFAEGGLELTQLARVRLPTGEELGMELHHRLAPHAPAPGFVARPGALAEGVGYFEVPRVRKGQGSFQALATRWDLQKGPITYAITRSTPPLLVDAVASGIDYWNRVAGAEVVRVERGAAPEVAGGERRVMVRWIPFSGATDAASAVQPDPATGEILAADIHVTSAFAASAAHTLAMAQIAGPAPGPAVSTPGFQPAAACRFTADPVALWSALTVGGGQAYAEGLSLAAMQDYVRLVVAHEVGHTLGLRHNFAGSLVSELATASARAEAWQGYVSGRTRP
ncbi:MAG TPA: zinc-dependent metalloprotease, partial [Myxococcota bacterium]|nr:zinc-dependent metalloprotease [Myxococcota bacterium]